MTSHSSVTCRMRAVIQSGATLIEAALVMFLLVVTVFFIIDLSRFFYTYLILNYAAYQGVSQATMLEVETDISDCSDTPGPLSAKCMDYKKRIKPVLDLAANLAYRVAGLAGSTRLTVLRKLLHYDDNLYSITGMDIPHDAGFLRPGERLLVDDATVVDHSSRPFGAIPGTGWPKMGESWNSLLAAHPLEMVFVVDFKAITPGIGTLRVVIRQRNFRVASASGVKIPTT